MVTFQIAASFTLFPPPEFASELQRPAQALSLVYLKTQACMQDMGSAALKVQTKWPGVDLLIDFIYFVLFLFNIFCVFL